MSETFLIKLQALKTATLLKETPIKFAKFLGTPYFTEHLQWLFLTVSGFQPATLLKRDSRKDVCL